MAVADYLRRVAVRPFAMAALISGFVSCATTEDPVGDPSHSTSVSKEVADLKFRGRWWSYYERAVLYLRQDSYDDARADLQRALSKRARDQRWPRTYGLHFMPEYFPNRELGICYFFEGRPEESVRYLEKSLEDYFTARGAYYLNLAREQVVSAAAIDQRGPVIRLISPDPGEVLASPIIGLEFNIVDDTYVRSVSVNGVEIPLRVSSRSITETFEVELSSGVNEVEIRAVDIVGNSTVTRQALRSDLDGPTVSFDDTSARPSRVSGIIADDSDVEYMRIGGISATLSVSNRQVSFEVDSAAIEPGAQFECADVYGNVTRGAVTSRAVAVATSRDSLYARLAIDGTSFEGPLLLAAADPDPTARPDTLDPLIEFTNLREGQRYLQREVVVGLLIRSPNPVANVLLNGTSIPQLLPERRVQHVTSKIALDELGAQEVIATASDLQGRSFETRVSIERALPAVYEVSNRLSVAMVGSLWRPENSEDRSLREYLAEELARALRDTNRFRVLDRDVVGDVLQEQELIAALGSPDERRNLGQLNLADYLFVADVRRFNTNLEVLVHAIDPATGRDIVIDVYGPASSAEQLQDLLELLALRVYQEFPRVQGDVISVLGDGDRVRTTVQKNDRVRESASCLLYRETEVIDAQTGQFLGTDLQPVASGVFTSIGGSRSTVRVEPAPNAVAEDSDLVITR